MQTASQPKKPRKGTRSCWECKHRKTKCVLATPTDVVCIGCSQRSTECVSQEYPDQTRRTGKSRLVGDRFKQIEASIARLARETARTGSATDGSPPGQERHGTKRRRSPSPLMVASSDISPEVVSEPPTPQGETIEIPGYFPCQENSPVASHPQAAMNGPVPAFAGNSKLQDLSRRLLAAYPNREAIDFLASQGFGFISFLQTAFKPYHLLDEVLEIPERQRYGVNLLWDRHTPEVHPVIIALQMLLLSNILEHLLVVRGDNVPIEQPRIVMARLADTAISLVTSQDNMLGTSEGLICLMLEGIYQGNQGNLRLAWLARRRTVALAQIMGFHRRPSRKTHSIQPGCEVDPTYTWYRILAADRFQSLMLGQPPASLDASMIDEPAFSQDTRMGQLERRHCVAAGRILERNDRDPNADDFALTLSIDADLQAAASAMPSRWWLVPDIRPTTSGKQLFWDRIRFLSQSYHFYLLHQLHLPYMLLGSAALPGGDQQHKYEYSRNTCISASRDILSRCLVFQENANLLSRCRNVDMWALMASLTLLLTHLTSKRFSSTGGGNSILGHQRLADRAMVEQALENMDGYVPRDGSNSGSRGAEMLRQLLAIGAGPAVATEGSTADGSDGPLRLFVPYFGVVVISHDGEISTEVLKQGADGTKDAEPQNMLPSPDAGTQNPGFNELGMGLAEGMGDVPLPTASADQWDLQGVDLAFFDSLTREAIMPTENNDNGLWSWTPPTGT